MVFWLAVCLTKVLWPVPPVRVLVPRTPPKVLLPLPAVRVSAPRPPQRVLLPLPAVTVSSPGPGVDEVVAVAEGDVVVRRGRSLTVSFPFAGGDGVGAGAGVDLVGAVADGDRCRRRGRRVTVSLPSPGGDDVVAGAGVDDGGLVGDGDRVVTEAGVDLRGGGEGGAGGAEGDHVGLGAAGDEDLVDGERGREGLLEVLAGTVAVDGGDRDVDRGAVGAGVDGDRVGDEGVAVDAEYAAGEGGAGQESAGF